MAAKKILAAAAALLMLGAAGYALVTGAGGTLITSASESERLEFSLVTPKTVYCMGSGTADGSEIVSVKVDANADLGVQSWVLGLDYDENAMEYVGTNGGIFSGLAVSDRDGALVINDYEMNDVSGSGTAFTVDFRLKKGTSPGSYSFKLTPSSDKKNFFSYADKDIGCTVAQSTVSSTVRYSVHSFAADLSFADTNENKLVNYSIKDNAGREIKGGGISSSDTLIISGLAAGKYTALLTCSGYAPVTLEFEGGTTKKVNDVTLCRYGDVNADGRINMRDQALLMQHLSGWSVDLGSKAAADVDRNGTLDMRDLARLQQYNSHKITSF